LGIRRAATPQEAGNLTSRLLNDLPRATVLFMTVGMLVLHVLEWKTAAGLEP
jgi:hypothetical protein